MSSAELGYDVENAADTDALINADLTLDEVIAAMERVEWSDVPDMSALEASVFMQRLQESQEAIADELADDGGSA